MRKSDIPTYHANNIFEIPTDFYIKNKYQVLLLDLDNTLESHKIKLPSQRVINLINELKTKNIRPIITSNNTPKRVRVYATALNVEYMYLLAKPFKFALIRKLKKLNIDPKICLIIGDQILTDVRCGSSARIHTLLTEKIVPEDQLSTRFNRIFENPIRARLKNCGKLNYWKRFYE